MSQCGRWDCQTRLPQGFPASSHPQTPSSQQLGLQVPPRTPDLILRYWRSKEMNRTNCEWWLYNFSKKRILSLVTHHVPKGARIFFSQPQISKICINNQYYSSKIGHLRSVSHSHARVPQYKSDCRNSIRSDFHIVIFSDFQFGFELNPNKSCDFFRMNNTELRLQRQNQT